MRMIDGDALTEKVDRLPAADIKNEYGQAYVLVRLSQVFDVIKTQPTIEERKKGKWEEREVLSEKVIDEWQSARCSVCGKYHTTPYMYYFDNYSFCPNCGARMEK